MTILLALAIYSGELPDLASRMKEAASVLTEADLRGHSFLCRETIKGILKRKKRRKNAK